MVPVSGDYTGDVPVGYGQVLEVWIGQGDHDSHMVVLHAAGGFLGADFCSVLSDVRPPDSQEPINSSPLPDSWAGLQTKEGPVRILPIGSQAPNS